MKATNNPATTYTITLDAAAGWSDIQANTLAAELRNLAETIERDGLAAFAERTNVTTA